MKERPMKSRKRLCKKPEPVTMGDLLSWNTFSKSTCGRKLRASRRLSEDTVAILIVDPPCRRLALQNFGAV
jgi:hypothetical protein